MIQNKLQGFAVLTALACLLVAAGCGSGGGAAATPPVVGTVVPVNGPKEGGTTITMTGANFTENTVITIAETPVVNFQFIDENTVTFDTPPVPGGTRAGVIVKNENGVTFKLDVFYFIPAPSVNSITPGTGKPEGLVPVTISGKGFVEFNAGANTVMFGGAPATSVVTVSDTAITCIIPPGSGPTDVSVTNNNGTGTKKNGYRYFPPPTLGQILPADGTPLGGTPITLTGTGFVNNSPGAPTVLIGGRPALNVVVVSDTQITADTPEGTPGPATVSVTNANGDATLGLAFEYYPYPTVTAVTPDNGSSDGAVDVTITGSGYTANAAGANTVTIGGVAATNVVIVDDTTITCTTPATSTGLKVVKVTNNNGSGELANAYKANLVALLGHESGTLYVVNTTNGSTSSIGAIGFTLFAMAFHPNGTLYGVTSNGKLITINIDTGAGTEVASLSPVPNPPIKDMTFMGTRLIGNNYRGTTFEINTSTAVTTQKSDFPDWNGQFRHGIGYDSINGILYHDSIGDSQYLTIDPDSGSYSVFSMSGGHHHTQCFEEWKGVIYMLSAPAFNAGAGRSLYTLSGGSTTTVGSTNVDKLAGTP